VEKVERLDRGKDCPLNSCPPLLLLHAQEPQEGFNMKGVYQATYTHYPWENMHCPSLLGVLA
jgi:hypothetical protein